MRSGAGRVPLPAWRLPADRPPRCASPIGEVPACRRLSAGFPTHSSTVWCSFIYPSLLVLAAWILDIQLVSICQAADNSGDVSGRSGRGSGQSVRRVGALITLAAKPAAARNRKPSWAVRRGGASPIRVELFEFRPHMPAMWMVQREFHQGQVRIGVCRYRSCPTTDGIWRLLRGR